MEKTADQCAKVIARKTKNKTIISLWRRLFGLNWKSVVLFCLLAVRQSGWRWYSCDLSSCESFCSVFPQKLHWVLFWSSTKLFCHYELPFIYIIFLCVFSITITHIHRYGETSTPGLHRLNSELWDTHTMTGPTEVKWDLLSPADLTV